MQVCNQINGRMNLSNSQNSHLSTIFCAFLKDSKIVSLQKRDVFLFVCFPLTEAVSHSMMRPLILIVIINLDIDGILFKSIYLSCKLKRHG